jgi:hypothetical protein
MRTTADYLALVPKANRNKPKFAAALTAILNPVVAAGAAARSLIPAFDIDTAEGVQLDVVGEWVGRSRHIATPLPNVYFSFDTPGLGFDQGVWRGPYDDERGLTSLDDDTYRKLLRAKILANSWDGSIPGANAILGAFFDDPETFVFVEDVGCALQPGDWFAFDTVGRGFDEGRWFQPWDEVNGAMTMAVNVSGKLPSALDLAILAGGYLPIKPAGVSVIYAVTSVDGSPVFGFDCDNEFIGGFDRGAFGITPDEVPTISA